MSNNIYDTKINNIKNDVISLINDLTNQNDNEISNFKNKYSYLYSTSKTLFDYIIKEHDKKTFNKDLFYINLDNMLQNILKIQNKELTQDDASKNIGMLLAKQFIPQYQ